MKSQNGHALFYSFDDRALYKKLKSWLPGQHPGLKFEFLGDTFADWSQWRPRQKKNLHPTTRILWRWTSMNENMLEFIKPALTNPENDVVIVQGFGREVYHYGIKYKDCPHALPFHKRIVEARVIEQEIPPPGYVGRRPTAARFQSADDAYFADKRQRMHYLESDTLEAQCSEVSALFKSHVRFKRVLRKIAA